MGEKSLSRPKASIVSEIAAAVFALAGFGAAIASALALASVLEFLSRYASYLLTSLSLRISDSSVPESDLTEKPELDTSELRVAGIALLIVAAAALAGLLNEWAIKRFTQDVDVLDEVSTSLSDLRSALDTGAGPRAVISAKDALRAALVRAHERKLLISDMPEDVLTSMSEIDQLDEAIRTQNEVERDRLSKRHTMRYFWLGALVSLLLAVFAQQLAFG